MRHTWIFPLLLVLVTGDSSAIELVKGPWLQNAKTDSMVVMWEADEQTTPAMSVDFGRTTDCELGTATAAHQSVNGFHVYTARLDGLAPDTLYHYRVMHGNTEFARATMKTALSKGTSGYRFYVVGDNRSNPGTWGLVANQILDDVRQYPQHHQTFVLNTGDLVEDGSDYADWDQLFPPAQALLAHMPMFVGFGNHEDRNTTASDGFLYGYFDFPYTESGSTDEKWYSFDYGNVHLAAMSLWDDDGYTSGPQYDWIQADLSSARQDPLTDWTFVFLHFLPWSLGSHDEGDAGDQQTYLHPVFQNEGVLCGLGGHNHLYSRYAPVNGVTYITTGGAGAGLHTSGYNPWDGAELEATAAVYHHSVVDVTEEAVSLRALDPEGSRLDWVTFGNNPLDLPPFADAGPDSTGGVGETLLLDGSASADPEGSGLSYAWVQIYGPPVSLDGDGQAQPSFTPDLGGDYLFQLRVSDGTTWSAPDFCRVHVSAGSVTIEPVADTYVDDGDPGSNFGTEELLALDNDPDNQKIYLRFEVSGVRGEVLSAILRLYCVDVGDPGEITTSPDTGWAETSPTWDDPLPENETIVGRINPSVADWVEADVAGAISGNGPVTLIIVPTGGGGADFHSRQFTHPPELVVSYSGEIVEPDGGDGTDAGADGGADPGPDAWVDAGMDAGVDAGADPGTDSGADAVGTQGDEPVTVYGSCGCHTRRPSGWLVPLVLLGLLVVRGARRSRRRG